MNRFFLLCIATVLSVAAPACGAVATFSPFNSVDTPPPQVTDVAIEARPGDRGYLTRASPRVLGWVSSTGQPEDEDISQAAREEAAKQGGTHILLRGSAKELDVVGGWGRQRIVESQRATYVVLRISPDNWDSLPEPLRPKLFTPSPEK